MWLELECVSDVPFLPHHLCLLIAGIKPPHNFAPNDRIIWGGGRLIKGTSPQSQRMLFFRGRFGAVGDSLEMSRAPTDSSFPMAGFA